MRGPGFVLFLQMAGGSIAIMVGAYLLLRLLNLDHLIADSPSDWLKIAIAPVIVTIVLLLAASSRK